MHHVFHEVYTNVFLNNGPRKITMHCFGQGFGVRHTRCKTRLKDFSVLKRFVRAVKLYLSQFVKSGVIWSYVNSHIS